MIELWNVVFLQPIMNGLLIVSGALGGSFGLAIIVLTIIVNVALLPLTLRQTRSMTAMQSVQAKVKELQAKCKDKRKIPQETMKLYKEAGMNPLGCILPMLVQTPFWIALFQSVTQALPTTPEHLLELSQRLYPWAAVQRAVPPDSRFLGMELLEPNLVLVALIIVSMWLTQKLMPAAASPDPKQQQMQKMMQWMMPVMMGFVFLNFPSGVALYIVVMNIFRMAVQYFVTNGWEGLQNLIPARIPLGSPRQDDTGWAPPKNDWTPSDKTAKEIEVAARKSRVTATEEEGIKDGSSRSKRKNHRRSGRTRSK